MPLATWPPGAVGSELAVTPEKWTARSWNPGYPFPGRRRSGDVCRKAGISQATFYAWRKKYAGLLPSEMRRLKALEDENARLKKLVAELSLDREMLQDVVRRKL